MSVASSGRNIFTKRYLKEVKMKLKRNTALKIYFITKSSTFPKPEHPRLYLTTLEG